MRLELTHPAVAAALATSIVQPLYDTTQIGVSNSGSSDLFQVPVGGAGVSGSGTKQLNDTNLTMNGQLSRIETLKGEDLYLEFFDKLSKSIFLEEQKI